MILCLECGNTCIKLAFFDEKGSIVEKFLLKTQEDLSSDEFMLKISLLTDKYKGMIEGAIISSVVPTLTSFLKESIDKLFKIDSKVLNQNLKTKLPIKIDNPKELGTDFICTAIGALSLYKAPLVIADLGTATKLSIIDKSGALVGCVISVGMNVSLKALSSSAAQLYDVTLVPPKKIIGKNTKESMQSGIVYGQAYMVSEFARRIENEIGYPLTRILTGGYSNIIKDQIVCFNYEENLSLLGLYLIYKMNEGERYEK